MRIRDWLPTHMDVTYSVLPEANMPERHKECRDAVYGGTSYFLYRFIRDRSSAYSGSENADGQMNMNAAISFRVYGPRKQIKEMMQVMRELVAGL